MSVISQIKWKLASTEKKLATLKKRGLTIGEGCEILNGYDFGSEPYLSLSVKMFASRRE